MAAGEAEAVELVFRMLNMSLQYFVPPVANLIGKSTKAVADKAVSTVSKGKQLKDLVKEGELAHVDVDKTNLSAFKKQLKRYKVKFTLYREPGTDKYHAFFTGTDMGRVNIALESVLKQMQPDRDQDKRQEVTEEITEAQEKETTQQTEQPTIAVVEEPQKEEEPVREETTEPLQQPVETVQEHTEDPVLDTSISKIATIADLDAAIELATDEPKLDQDNQTPQTASQKDSEKDVVEADHHEEQTESKPETPKPAVEEQVPQAPIMDDSYLASLEQTEPVAGEYMSLDAAIAGAKAEVQEKQSDGPSHDKEQSKSKPKEHTKSIEPEGPER